MPAVWAGYGWAFLHGSWYSMRGTERERRISPRVTDRPPVDLLVSITDRQQAGIHMATWRAWIRLLIQERSTIQSIQAREFLSGTEWPTLTACRA